jgi:hypothetical protein
MGKNNNKGERYGDRNVVLFYTMYLSEKSFHFFRIIPENFIKIDVLFCNDVIFYYNGVDRMNPKSDVNIAIAYYLGYLRHL